MKLKIEINDGDDLSFLRAILELTAVVRKHAPDACRSCLPVDRRTGIPYR